MAVNRHHYPRHDFTHRVYENMATGFSPFLTLFAPRRTGKTEFLTRDLAPKAAGFGHRVVYVDFMERDISPLALLLYAIDMAMRPRTVLGKVLAATAELAPRVTLTALKGAEVEISLARPHRTYPEDQILLLDSYLDQLSKAKQMPFLLFDEFQDITEAPDHASLMTALRSGFSSRPGRFAAMFTGSQQNGLRKIFSARNAPFYRFATALDLPPLGADFVTHQLALYPGRDRAPIGTAAAQDAFRRLGANPEYFQRFLRARNYAPDREAEHVLGEIEAEIAGEQSFDETWVGLKDRDRLALRLIADGVGQIYGQEGEEAAQALGLTKLPSGLQTSINKLQNRGLAIQIDRLRVIADPVFRDWIRARPEGDFRDPA